MRSDPTTLLADALVDALRSIGLQPDMAQRPDNGADQEVDLVLTDATTGVRMLVQCKSVATRATVDQLVRATLSQPGYRVLASRRISTALRRDLIENGIGFYDGRGHLRLHHPPMVVDTSVPALSSETEAQRTLRMNRGSALLDTALWILRNASTEEQPELAVRTTATAIGRAPGTVSKSLATLRSAGLVDDDNSPVVPDLFLAVLDEWRPKRFPLASLPQPAGASVAEQLELGFNDDEPGWVLADIHAAYGWGAPVVLDSTSPPDFYVPSVRSASKARALLGDAEFGSHACTVAVAPSPVVCDNRFDQTNERSSQIYMRASEWLLPSPAIAALDLGSDPGRGQEVLDDWTRRLEDTDSKVVQRVW